ncbi:hypothetical protein F8388_015953 [Cannabis sativa]|uniref:ubiquitinyl hydrolase 1 n=2 Tax=Cannabis sativa TaxID=3483 RepID=A0A7J6EEX5_CANSA|nr:hypothetical protein F8388_015953 [Cannabis sativa]
MAEKPSNETILEQLKNGVAKFELVSVTARSISTHDYQTFQPSFPEPVTGSLLESWKRRITGHEESGTLLGSESYWRWSLPISCTGIAKGMAMNKGIPLSPRDEREDAEVVLKITLQDSMAKDLVILITLDHLISIQIALCAKFVRDDLRMAVKEVICNNGKERHQYEEALVAITVDESLKRYCQRIGRPDFWGGESELLVLSKLIRQPITVYLPEHEHTRGGRGTGFIPIAEYGAEFSKGSVTRKPKKVLMMATTTMEGASNGGILYHEVQESKLCAVHCVNTVLQGPFFSEFDLAALASDLDLKERQMMIQGAAASSGDFFSEESHNVSLDGDFSIQVLEKALEVWDLQVIPLHSPVAEPAQIDPELENAFICHLHDHWFCIRKVNGEWYNFDSLYAAPMHLSKFYLSAYLDTLKGAGWSIFLVRGNFPKECPISASEASNGYGQWLSPEDAERITKSLGSSTQAPSEKPSLNQQSSDLSYGEAEMLSQMEDDDLKAAIAASLMDSAPASSKSEAVASSQDENESSKNKVE